MFTVQLTLRLTVVILLGFFARKKNVVDDNFTMKLSAFLINAAMPCMILNSFLSNAFSPAELKKSIALMGAMLGMFLILMLIGNIFFVGFGKGPVGAAIRSFAIFSNTNFYGALIAKSLYGEQGLFYFLMMIFPMRIIFFGFAESFIRHEKRKDSLFHNPKQVLRQFSSPAILSIYVGMFLYVAEIELPAVLSGAIADVGGICSTMGIILCGTSMGKYSLKELFGDKKNFIIPALRALLLPAICLLYVGLLPLEDMLKRILIIYPTLPAPSFIPAMIMQYNPNPNSEKMAGSAIFITTLLSAIVCPFWIMLSEKLLF